ncbi:MAG TPA: beta-ketoacyl-ACP synthase III [Chthoniobacterales bacterium]
MPTQSPLRSVSITGTGSYVPERILTNADLEKMVETSNEWILTRTGIRERRIAAENQNTSDLSVEAAKKAMEQAGVTALDLDLIIVATVTPDTFFPATACWVQKKLGAKNAAAFDLSAACSGFLYAVETARQFIGSGAYETVLVIGADKLSSCIDWTDRNTCVLFGDGAGAAILQHRPGSRGILTTKMGSDGNFSDILIMPGGGSACPVTPENFDKKLNTIKMLGKETYKQAVIAMTGAAMDVLGICGLTPAEIKCVIPHQANVRIIEAIADRLKLPMNQFFVNLDLYGNTSAAAVAIALDEANRTGRFQRGDNLLLVVFGGGLTWASAVIEW